MGSGLILLVIVGAWLAVLVPLGLRSSGGSDPLLSAVPREPPGAREPGRVLSRRGRAEPRVAAGPEPAADLEPADDPEPRPEPRPEPLPVPGSATEPEPVVPARRAGRDVPPAARRRRGVLALLVLLAVTLVAAAAAGPEVLLATAGGLGGLLVLVVVHLRRSAVHRRVLAQAERRALEAELRAARLAEQERLRREAAELALEQERARRLRDVPGIPSRMPPRPAPPARRHRAPVQAAGGEWQPRPVPLPMYVRQAPSQRPAPARAPQPVAPPAAAAEPAVYEHRRVPGGW